MFCTVFPRRLRCGIYNNRRLFTSESSNPSVPMSFAVYLDLGRLSMCSSPSSSDKHRVIAMHCHSHILIRMVEQCCAVFASLEASQLSTDHVHIIKLRDVGSVLSSAHALDQSANFVFTMLLTILCGKFAVNESLSCSLEMCSADVAVSQLQWFPLFDKFIDIMIETNTLTASRGGMAENNQEAGGAR